MIVKDMFLIDTGLLILGDNVIAVCEGGVMERESFIPSRFVYEFVHTYPVKEEKENE